MLSQFALTRIRPWTSVPVASVISVLPFALSFSFFLSGFHRLRVHFPGSAVCLPKPTLISILFPTFVLLMHRVSSGLFPVTVAVYFGPKSLYGSVSVPTRHASRPPWTYSERKCPPDLRRTFGRCCLVLRVVPREGAAQPAHLWAPAVHRRWLCCVMLRGFLCFVCLLLLYVAPLIMSLLAFLPSAGECFYRCYCSFLLDFPPPLPGVYTHYPRPPEGVAASSVLPAGFCSPCRLSRSP